MKYYLIFIAFSIFIMALPFLFLSNLLPDKIPLFYSLPWGESQLTNKFQLFILPAILLATTLVNLSLVSQLHTSQVILKRMLLVNVIVIDIIVLISFFKIITIFL